jgi:hypothetical protein
MHRSTRLPARFSAGTKYVLEARGPWVHRTIEFPDGRTVQLASRKALICACAGQTLVPANSPAAEPRRRKHLVAAA